MLVLKVDNKRVNSAALANEVGAGWRGETSKCGAKKISGNVPVIKGTDYGIWRRIKLIPFTTRIPEERQDRRLEKKLKAEASGILNWLLEGTARWRRGGLVVPAAILNATDEYRGKGMLCRQRRGNG